MHFSTLSVCEEICQEILGAICDIIVTSVIIQSTISEALRLLRAAEGGSTETEKMHKLILMYSSTNCSWCRTINILAFIKS